MITFARSFLHMPLLGALLAASFAASFAAGCNKAESVQLSPNKPVLIESTAPAIMPVVVALDGDGNPLEEAPPVTFLVEPDGLVKIENGKLVAQKNGKGKLKAIVEDLPPAELPLEVLVVEDFKVTCPSPCELHAGETTTLAAEAIGLGGEKITQGMVWTTSDDKRAHVDAAGKVTAVSPGPVVLVAHLGKKSAETTLMVRASIDEIRMVCPWPPMLAHVKKGQAPGALELSCEVAEGEAFKLTAQLFSAGHLVEDEHVDWKSTDPSVRVIDGLVTGDKVGGAMVEASAQGIALEMPVSVQKPKKPIVCPAGDDAYKTDVPVALKLANAAGDPWESTVVLRCALPTSKKCIDEGVATLAAAANVLAVDTNGIASFAQTTLDGRAARCCCRR